jgi:N-acetylglucosaminyldiphosphoundecaprenol N-acetyl-beta-D-mannosaminyltransferase
MAVELASCAVEDSLAQGACRVERPSRSASACLRARVRVGNAAIDRLTMDECVRWIAERMTRLSIRGPLLIMASNAQVVTLAERNRSLARALAAADLNVPDGMSVVLASRLLGLPVSERVAGGELMERLCAEGATWGWKVFLLGGLPGAAAMAGARLAERYPGLEIAGWCCPPYGFERDARASAAVRAQIAAAAPDLLCVALGAPKQEIWMLENSPSLPVRAAIAVGGALDTCAGLRRRAPRWTHGIGLEWLYRLIREPRRLWRRYLIGNAQFAVLVARQLAAEGFGELGAGGPQPGDASDAASGEQI